MKIAYMCLVVVLAACANNVETKEKKTIAKDEFVCIPCGAACDDSTYTSAGSCMHCKMELVNKNTIVHKSIKPAAMCALNEKEVIFLDVRMPEEFNGMAEQKFGAIKNAINIPVQELQQRMTELEPYKNKKLIVYCSHSHRSPRASYMLTQNGFSDVTNMQGGMSVWKEEVKDGDCNKKLYINQ
jgi:rhodanese-related sulfurtransferase